MTTKFDAKQQTILIFAAAIAVRAAFNWLTGYTFDDAYITFRYAANLIDGHGLVYNLSESVLGTTTPLFTMLLAALGLVGIPIGAAALAISLLACGLTAVVIYRFALRLDFGQWAFLPVIIYVIFPRLLPTDTGGMETALFTFLVTVAFYCRHCKMAPEAIVAASLATLTRPEGLMVLALLFAEAMIRDRRHLLGRLVLATMIILPWVLFAWWYFGSPIPHSMTAKMALYGQVWARPLLDKIIFVMGWHSPLGWLLALAAVVGLWQPGVRSDRRMWLEAIWILATFTALASSSTLIFRWYMAPVYPIYIMLASMALLWVIRRWPEAGRMFERGRVVILALVVIALLAVNFRTVRYYQAEASELDTIHQGIVDYLENHAAPGDLLATEDIGYVGYYSGMRILDRAGLVSPEVVAYNRTGDFYGPIAEIRPRWLVISPKDPTATFLDSADFVANYYQVAQFEPLAANSWAFRLYQLQR
jgi:hypothetical protein